MLNKKIDNLSLSHDNRELIAIFCLNVLKEAHAKVSTAGQINLHHTA